MLTIDEYKSLLLEQASYHLDHGNLRFIDKSHLRFFVEGTKEADTLSELAFCLRTSADLLYKHMSDGWITQLTQLAEPKVWEAHHILINPTTVPADKDLTPYLALYDRYTAVQQTGGLAFFIGPCELHIAGGIGHVIGPVQVYASDQARLFAHNQATVHATGQSENILYGFSRCDANEQSIVYAYNNCRVNAAGDNKVTLSDFAQGVSIAGNQQWLLTDRTLMLIDANRPKADQLTVKMNNRSHLFNASTLVHPKIETLPEFKGDVVNCSKSKLICDALYDHIQRTPTNQQTTCDCEVALPIEESKALLDPALPDTITETERAAYQQATTEQALCAAVEQIMRNHPDHKLTADTLAMAFTQDTLLEQHIYLRDYIPLKKQEQGYYHIFGNRTVIPSPADTNTYVMNGSSTMLTHADTPVIANQQSTLIQLGNATQNSVLGEAQAIALSEGALVAHGHSQVVVAGQVELQAYDQVNLRADQQAKVDLHDQATGICGGRSKGTAKDHSRVVGVDRANIKLYDHSAGAVLSGSQAKLSQEGEQTRFCLLKDIDACQAFLSDRTTPVENVKHRKV